MHFDLLAKIKNAQAVRKESFLTAYSKLNLEVGKIMVHYRYLKGIEKRTINHKIYLEVKPNYRSGVPALTDFRVVSKPGRKLYKGYRELRPVKQHYGLGILTTPNGLLTQRDAIKQKVGGEYLCEIW